MAKVGDKDYYAILGVKKNASESEIKHAYRELARKYHPDANPGPDAEARFMEIHEAYTVLSNPVRRRGYDALREDQRRRQQEGRRAATGPRPYPPKVPLRSASGQFARVHQTRGARAGGKGGIAVDLDLKALGISLGLGALGGLISGLDRVMSSPDEAAASHEAESRGESDTEKKG